MSAATEPVISPSTAGRSATSRSCDPKHKDKTHIGEDRRLGYLKLFKTKNDKFVCQRMWLVDDEEKHYKATTVDDIIGIKDFFGNDSLALAMMMMLDRISKNW